MFLNAYSILDTKAGLYTPPFFLLHDALAMRASYELAKDKSTTPGKYPSDFVLYRIGLFDDNTGTVSPVNPHNMGALSAILAAFDEGSR